MSILFQKKNDYSIYFIEFCIQTHTKLALILSPLYYGYKRSIKTTDRNDPDQDTAVQCSLETIGCPSASNRFASLQTEEDTHEVDELGEELLEGAEGT